MQLSMYQASIPVFIKGLTNLSAILNKAIIFADAKKVEQSVLINSRLAPDMFPLSRQIQIMADAAKGCAARLAGVEVPSYPDNEASFQDLKERIAKTITFLKTLSEKQIDGSEDKTITLTLRGNEMKMTGLALLLNFALPNFYFHMTITYAILRHNGVEIGKPDFLGAL